MIRPGDEYYCEEMQMWNNRNTANGKCKFLMRCSDGHFWDTMGVYCHGEVACDKKFCPECGKEGEVYDALWREVHWFW